MVLKIWGGDYQTLGMPRSKHTISAFQVSAEILGEKPGFGKWMTDYINNVAGWDLGAVTLKILQWRDPPSVRTLHWLREARGSQGLAKWIPECLSQFNYPPNQHPEIHKYTKGSNNTRKILLSIYSVSEIVPSAFHAVPNLTSMRGVVLFSFYGWRNWDTKASLANQCWCQDLNPSSLTWSPC